MSSSIFSSREEYSFKDVSFEDIPFSSSVFISCSGTLISAFPISATSAISELMSSASVLF